MTWLQANPGKGSQGTAGAGSPSHVSGIYLQNVTGAQFTFVPYRGAAPAMQDLAAGQIDFMIDQASNSIPHQGFRRHVEDPYAGGARHSDRR